MSGPKLLFVLVSQTNLSILTLAPKSRAHEEAWEKGSLDGWMPTGGHCPALTWLSAPTVAPSGHPAQFLQLLTNEVTIKINQKVNFLFPTLQVHNELWLLSKV